jgi:adenylate cyclase
MVGSSRARPGKRRIWRLRLAPWALGVALVVGFGILRLWDPYPVKVLRLKGFDIAQQMDPRALPEGPDGAPTSPIVIVNIDEESLDRIGQWPWPRTVMADLVDRVAEGGAAAIGFDVLFTEPDRMSPDALADRIADYDGDLAQQLRYLPGNDDRLAQAFRRHAGVVVAQAIHHRNLQHDVGPVNEPSVAQLGSDVSHDLVSARGVIRPLPELADAAAGVGMISLWESPDNVVRRVPLMMRANDRVYPSLSLEMLRVATGQQTYVLEGSAAGVESVLIGRYRVPTDHSGQIWVHYRPKLATQYLSAADVLKGARLPTDSFRNKLVLVGTSATGLGDIKATPLDPALPGVDIHAQVLETILSGTVLTRPAIADSIEVFATLAIGVSIVLLVPLVGAWTALVTGAILAAAVLAMTGYAFFQERLLFDPWMALMTGFSAFSVMVFASYLGAERDKRFIRGAFTQYLTPALVDRLASEPDLLQLGGETRPATVLFSDIRGFTGIAERYGDDARGLTTLVNRFLTPLSDRILANRGTIDKYIGDAIMAFWNAPIDDPKHADHACQAALEMVEALQALNAEMAGEAQPGQEPVVLKAGIGINSGRCLAGNLGSDKRFNYSVMGDPVNVAARLEALTRKYGVDIIVGEATLSAVEGEFALLELDHVQVKGRRQPARIFALLGGSALGRDPDFKAFEARHTAMLRTMRQADRVAARRQLDALAVAAEGYGLSLAYAFYATSLDETDAARPAQTYTSGV